MLWLIRLHVNDAQTRFLGPEDEMRRKCTRLVSNSRSIYVHVHKQYIDTLGWQPYRTHTGQSGGHPSTTHTCIQAAKSGSPPSTGIRIIIQQDYRQPAWVGLFTYYLHKPHALISDFGHPYDPRETRYSLVGYSQQTGATDNTHLTCQTVKVLVVNVPS